MKPEIEIIKASRLITKLIRRRCRDLEDDTEAKLLLLNLKIERELIKPIEPDVYKIQQYLIALVEKKHTHFDWIIGQAFNPTATNKFGDVRHTGFYLRNTSYGYKGKMFETWLLNGTGSFSIF